MSPNQSARVQSFWVNMILPTTVSIYVYLYIYMSCMILYDHRIAHQKIQNFHEIIEVIEIYSMNSGVPPTESMKSSRRRVTSTIKTRCPGSTGWNKSAGNNGFQLFLLVYFGFSCKKSIVYIYVYIYVYIIICIHT